MNTKAKGSRRERPARTWQQRYAQVRCQEIVLGMVPIEVETPVGRDWARTPPDVGGLQMLSFPFPQCNRRHLSYLTGLHSLCSDNPP